MRFDQYKTREGKPWPLSVTMLFHCCIARIPVGMGAIENARIDGPEFFNKYGEFDPLFTSRHFLYPVMRFVRLTSGKIRRAIRSILVKYNIVSNGLCNKKCCRGKGILAQIQNHG